MPKLIPGEQLATHVASIGNHVGGAVASNAQRKADESAASRIAAESDPSAWAEAEKHKTHRSLGKTAIIAGSVLLVAGGVIGTAVYGINQARSAAEGLTDSLKPHEPSVIEAQAIVDKITFPAELDSVHAHVSATSLFHTDGHWLITVPFGESDTAAASSGTVEMKVATTNNDDAEKPPKEIIKYITLEVSKSTDGKWQLSAGIDPRGIRVSYADVSNDLPAGIEAATDGVTRRFVGVFRGNNGGDREKALIKYTNTYAETTCMPIIQTAYKAGISKSINESLKLAISPLQQHGDVAAAKFLDELTSNDVAVYFGSTSRDAVDISFNAFMPKLDTPSEFAASVGADPEYATTTNAPDCTAAQSAVNTLLGINNQVGNK